MKQSVHIRRFSNVIVIHLLELDPLDVIIIVVQVGVHVLLRQLFFLVEVFVFVNADFGFQGTVNEASLVFVGDQVVRIYLSKGDSFFRVDRQATVNKVSGILRYVNLVVVRPIIFNFLEDVIVVHAHVRVFSIQQLVIHNPD